MGLQCCCKFSVGLPFACNEILSILLDFLEILSDGVGTMELKEGYNSLEEQEFFEWINAEHNRIESNFSLSENERDERFRELHQLSMLSQPSRYSDYMHQNFLNRIKSGKSFYNKLPLVHHKTSSTVK